MDDKPKEPTGRAKGGLVVAAKMTPEERSNRASKGAVQPYFWHRLSGAAADKLTERRSETATTPVSVFFIAAN